MRTTPAVIGSVFAVLGIGCDVGRMGTHFYLHEFIDDDDAVSNIDRPLEDVIGDRICPSDYFFENLNIDLFDFKDGRLYYKIWTFSEHSNGDGRLDIHFAEEWQDIFDTVPVISDTIRVSIGDTVRTVGNNVLSPEAVQWIQDGTFTVGMCYEFWAADTDIDRFKAEIGVEELILELEFDTDF